MTNITVFLVKHYTISTMSSLMFGTPERSREVSELVEASISMARGVTFKPIA